MRKVTKINENNDLLKNKPKLRVAAYARVSTDSDEQMVSLETQKVHYESYIKANPDWEFSGVYYDEGITGTKKDKRTGLLSLIRDCERRKIDFIVTKSISRFARNTMDCLELVRKLTDLGIFMYFEKENINTKTMDSELMLTILSSLAENESISISENAKWSIQRRYRNGTYKLSNPPYGYDYVYGEILINEEKAKVIKRIFSDVLSGKGTEKIAQELNEEKVPTKKKGQWRGSTIRGILRNEKYIGDALFQKTYTNENFNRKMNSGEMDQYLIQNNHEAIISNDDFEQVELVLKRRGEEKGVQAGGNKYQNRYLFSGKIICEECGGIFKRRISKTKINDHITWHCTTHINNIDMCSMLSIREDHIHQAFIIMIDKLIYGNKYILRPLLQELKAMSYSDNPTQVQEIDLKVEDNREKIRVLASLMTKGYLEPELYNRQNNELRLETEKLKIRKDTLYHTITAGMSKVSDLDKLLKYVGKAKKLKEFDNEVFERFVDKIIVLTPTEIGFSLKCGLLLKERMER